MGWKGKSDPNAASDYSPGIDNGIVIAQKEKDKRDHKAASDFSPRFFSFNTKEKFLGER